MTSAPQLAAAHPLLLGHRGALNYAPENTIAAFDLALEHGCHGFEFDVRLTADMVAVVCHDPDVHGLTIAASTLEQLRERIRRENLRRKNKDSFSAPLELPTLNEVLERYASSAVLDIELKVEGLELLALEALRTFPLQRTYWVSSFLPGVLTRMHALDPSVPLGLICRRRGQLAGWRQLPISVVVLHHGLLSRELVGELHDEGKQVLVWAINDEASMRSAADMPVEGILSDDTRLLARVLGKTHQWAQQPGGTPLAIAEPVT
ncbi:MAG: glycerophosphodiester phosphodiesterase [Candidatus Korobacteraceae bacterium]